MAGVRLEIADATLAMTLRAILNAAGHEITSADPEALITDDLANASSQASTLPTLVLAGAGQIAEAVQAMRQGVVGYLFVPLQPGEADLMVRRAISSVGAREADEAAPLSLQAMERRHILDVVRRCAYNHAQAARVLGIGRNTLWRKLRAYQAEDPPTAS